LKFIQVIADEPNLQSYTAKQVYDKLQQLKRVGKFPTEMETEVDSINAPRKASWRKEETEVICKLFGDDFKRSQALVRTDVIGVISHHASAKILLDTFSEEQIIAKVRYERQKRRKSR